LVLEDNMDIFYHIIFTSDHYYQFKEYDNNFIKLITFMKILIKLLIELQMIIVLRLLNLHDCIISSDLLDVGLKRYIKSI
jgi:hypothetical protein